MDRFVYPPYSVYQSYGRTFTSSHNVAPRPPPKQKQSSWKQSKNSSTPNPYRGPPPALSSDPRETSPDYLDTYKRAQLKALLSQVSPGLGPRLRKTSTKEVGVQVNPRVDAAVQCSLGSRPLQAVRPQSPSARLTREPPLPGIYSPVVGRRLFTLPEAVVEPQEQDGAPASQPLAEEEPEEKAAWETGGKETPLGENRGEESALRPDCKGEGAKKGGNARGEGKIASFQFLEQKYGYFHCNNCKTRWESAYVWCISGTNKVYFKQLCRKCQKGFNPYKVEAIMCQLCSKTRCSCPQKKRHIDLKRPHRQELCGRCKGKRLSCDNTYSFKYIV
ncbi:zygote arrest protein 2.S-like [Heteronotia binoei]|uniref:protein ZAR1-like n=1 Tax=Heteronotia binoei TaxID=13085 RepID=UPI00292D6F57|nr:protein ZAR1-like [Heteronotia binoei]XP_060119423.1 zygote arrest protein 2.S-like [Heteronotia binoei]